MIVRGDALHLPLSDECIQTCVTSPPYWSLRNYGSTLGLEPTPELYVEHLVEIFREVRRVLRTDGTVWLNLGDSYCGSGVNDGTTNPGLSKAVARGDVKGRRPSQSIRGLKPKDLVGIPWAVAFALRADGWWLRSDIIWAKTNAMPESVKDRPTASHEYLFLLSKSADYYYDAKAIHEPMQSGPSDLKKMIESKDRIGGLVKEQDDPLLRASGRTNIGRKRSVGNGQAAAVALDKQRGHSRRHAGFNDRWDQMSKEEQQAGGRNKRSVWTMATQPYKGAHFATMPEALVVPCILAGSPEGGTVLDPFAGSGTVGVVCKRLARRFVGIELNPEYVALAEQRIGGQMILGMDT